MGLYRDVILGLYGDVSYRVSSVVINNIMFFHSTVSRGSQKDSTLVHGLWIGNVN